MLARECCPPPAGVDNPEALFPLGDRVQVPELRTQHRGRSPRGPGGSMPHAEERLRRGPEAGGKAACGPFARPPLGGLDMVPLMRTTYRERRKPWEAAWQLDRRDNFGRSKDNFGCLKDKISTLFCL